MFSPRVHTFQACTDVVNIQTDHGQCSLLWLSVFCLPRKGCVWDCMHIKTQKDVSLTTRLETGERRCCEVLVVLVFWGTVGWLGSMDGGRGEFG